MAQTAAIDEKGRIVLPKNARRKAGIEPRAKLLVEVRGAGIIELKDYDRLTRLELSMLRVTAAPNRASI